MEYLNTGVFNLDMTKLNMVSVMNRALYNKVFNIDVFISDNKITILSIDLSGNTIYLLKEQDIQDNQLIQPDKPSINLNIGNIFGVEDEGIEFQPDDDIDIDLIESLLDENPDEGIQNGQQNTQKPGMKFEWSNSSEINVEKSGSEPNFGVDILSKSLENMERSERDDFSEDEENFTTEISEIPEEMRENLVISTQTRVCRFSTSIKMLKSLGIFKKVTVQVEEDKIKLISKEDMVSMTFPRIKSYTDLGKYNKMVQEIKWERFPADMVKKVIPLVDRIEPDKRRQKLAIKDGKIYMFSDQIAVSVKTNKMFNSYILTNDMLRVLKYATSNWSKVYVGYYNKGIAFDIDGLVIIYSLADKTVPKNLIDLLNEDKLIYSGQISKHTAKIFSLVDSIGEDKTMKIEISPEKAVISTNKLSAYTDLTGEKRFSFDLLIDRILLALKIVGTKTPNINMYLLGNKVVISVSNRDLRVIIEGNNYSETR